MSKFVFEALSSCPRMPKSKRFLVSCFKISLNIICNPDSYGQKLSCVVVTGNDDSKYYDIFIEFEEFFDEHILLDRFQKFGARGVDVITFKDEETEEMVDVLFRLLESKRGKFITKDGFLPASIHTALEKKLKMEKESAQGKWTCVSWFKPR